MCMIEDCDDYSIVWSKKKHRASKAWTCDECGRTIAAGEHYERFQGLSCDKYWWTCRTCAHCLVAREWLNRECGGFVYAGVREDLEDHWSDGPLMRVPSLGRLIVGMRRRWRDREGNLMRLEALTP